MSQYYSEKVARGPKRTITEADIVRKCLSRSSSKSSFMAYADFKVVYRQYASLFFIVGVDNDENEFGILEFIHAFVVILDSYFGNVCELDIMFNLEKVHYILDECVANGSVVDMNSVNVLRPLKLMDFAME
eukprot:CAMPEP_0201488868 /NCGR_PEP_ID=MMETSP0151_2-20130828/19974_1 /ASSEMBLY_ACC=CAM_ASM_000257 /TAXON_ID=200890 /ORGANISM="Paramoeba atlantica, Strain 621/1 / CCAP 1560/9" /LENGTH=130 /DNA_ID=CAMNT_0047874259 /DNA_START=133 /DNA_END=525 /DNA_ORIENTATION=-